MPLPVRSPAAAPDDAQGPAAPQKSVAHLVFDVALAVSLVAALGAVYLFDRSSASDKPAVDEPTVVEAERQIPETKEPGPKLRLAVTKPLFDDMGKLLDMLGEGYQHDTISLNELLSPDTFSKFDIIFVTCSGIPQEWCAAEIGAAARDMTVVRVKDEVLAQLKQHLREFVGAGGTLYVSDLHYPMVASAFEEFVDARTADEGDKQEVDARVIDERLREALGEKNLTLKFDQPAWRVAAFAGHGVEILLEGDYLSSTREKRVGPLLARFPLGKGTVIFTSFHNEVQNSKTEIELLKFLVFSTVSARSEATVRETMVQGGFSPQRSSLLSTSGGELAVTKTYDCRGTGPLSFALAFENQGATLELTVVDPEGNRQVKEGSESFRLEYEHGKVGVWEYTVKAKSVPYANFPFTLTVWSK